MRATPTVLAATLLTAFLVGIGAAPALAEPGTGPGVSDPPRASTEATVVAMRHQSGLFGAQETAITDPQTPYPTTITGTPAGRSRRLRSCSTTRTRAARATSRRELGNARRRHSGGNDPGGDPVGCARRRNVHRHADR